MVKKRNRYVWYIWFAWYPVIAQDSNGDEYWVWLRRVDRKNYSWCSHIYRLLEA